MAEAQINRPLSPHIQIYKWTLQFLMSGFHRATGFALYFGFVLRGLVARRRPSGPAHTQTCSGSTAPSSGVWCCSDTRGD